MAMVVDGSGSRAMSAAASKKPSPLYRAESACKRVFTTSSGTSAAWPTAAHTAPASESFAYCVASKATERCTGTRLTGPNAPGGAPGGDSSASAAAAALPTRKHRASSSYVTGVRSGSSRVRALALDTTGRYDCRAPSADSRAGSSTSRTAGRRGADPLRGGGSMLAVTRRACEYPLPASSSAMPTIVPLASSTMARASAQVPFVARGGERVTMGGSSGS
mmetsp:Transcript_21949/g.56446  ORF Transcript_21949/g.56446 Transcript_21949/m.56446 type:complete len:220 (+) Transcript_21949:1048-1707(+)